MGRAGASNESMRSIDHVDEGIISLPEPSQVPPKASRRVERLFNRSAEESHEIT
jgi:hypothetical protein